MVKYTFWINIFCFSFIFEDRFGNILIFPKIKDYPVIPYSDNN